jgi:hypothetical protein
MYKLCTGAVRTRQWTVYHVYGYAIARRYTLSPASDGHKFRCSGISSGRTKYLRGVLSVVILYFKMQLHWPNAVGFDRVA